MLIGGSLHFANFFAVLAIHHYQENKAVLTIKSVDGNYPIWTVNCTSTPMDVTKPSKDIVFSYNQDDFKFTEKK